MKRYGLAAAVILVLLSPWRQAPTADVATYTVQSLGVTSDGLVPSVTGINASGQVSGFVIDGGGNFRAVRYTNGAGWEYLPGLGAGSLAAAINVHGDLTGLHSVGDTMYAFRYTDSTGVVEDILPLPNGTYTVGQSINANGDVVGYGDGDGQAWIARAGSPAVALPGLGGSSVPWGINDLGQVALTSSRADGTTHAARVETDGLTVVDLGALEDMGSSAASSIDQQGRVGGAASVGGVQHAFVYNGQLLDIVSALPITSSNVESVAAGKAAGEFTSSVDGQSHALLYTSANGTVDLNTVIDASSGWFLNDVKGINAAGMMAGDGMLNGAPAAFLLKPVTTDTTPPVIASVTASPNALLAGNALVPVSVQVLATDDSGQPPACAVTSVDGGAGDSQVNGPLTVSLRSTPNTTYTVHVTCSDAAGNNAASSVNVAVGADTTAPAIASVSASPSTISPADNSLVPVTVSVSATDNVDASPACSVTSVTGGAAGNSSVTGPLTVQVRAAGGAVYTLNVRCADASGNASTASTSVTVVNAPPTDQNPPVIRFLHAERNETRLNGVKWELVRVFVFATDNVDRSPECSITSITGAPAGSFAITGRLSARVRAQRSLGDLDRVYQLHVTCVDDAGNAAQATVGIDPNGRTTYSGEVRHWRWF